MLSKRWLPLTALTVVVAAAGGCRDDDDYVSPTVEDGVVVSLNGFRSANSHGLCIYLPSTNDGMHSMKVGYDEVPFAVETSWYDFVWDFSNFYGRTWGL